MTRQADGVGTPSFQETATILWLAFPHEPFTRLMTIKTVAPLQRFVHGDHLRIFAVADFAFKGMYR